MKNKGFSLVELIVVIAIMAILVGVAVPVYTSYIEKAEISKDKQLVDEVAHAIQIGQASGQNFGAAYIILSADGAPAISSTDLETYLKTVFGESLEGLELAYDEWTIKANALNAALALDAAAAEAIGNSSYLTNSDVNELLGNVQTVTSAAAGLLGSVAKSEDAYISALNLALGDGYLEAAANAGIINKSDEGIYSLKEGTYTTSGSNIVPSEDLQNQLANLMVFSVADELKGADSATMQALMLSSSGNVQAPSGYSSAAVMASQYAFFKAFAVDTGNTDSFDAMNAQLQEADGKDDALAALDSFYQQHKAEFDPYLMDNMDRFVDNTASIPAIMVGVSSVSGSYANSETLKSGDLFSSGEAAGDVNAFVGAASLLDTLTADQKTVLGSVTNGVVIFLNSDGSITVIPTMGN